MNNSRIINAAMKCPDNLVVCLEYEDSKGQRTRRVVSPIRYTGRSSFLALCLCRCEPRRFELERCTNLQLRNAAEYLMPVELVSAS